MVVERLLLLYTVLTETEHCNYTKKNLEPEGYWWRRWRTGCMWIFGVLRWRGPSRETWSRTLANRVASARSCDPTTGRHWSSSSTTSPKVYVTSNNNRQYTTTDINDNQWRRVLKYILMYLGKRQAIYSWIEEKPDKVGRPQVSLGKQVHGMWYFSIQCFDTVGWATGRASGL